MSKQKKIEINSLTNQTLLAGLFILCHNRQHHFCCFINPSLMKLCVTFWAWRPWRCAMVSWAAGRSLLSAGMSTFLALKQKRPNWSERRIIHDQSTTVTCEPRGDACGPWHYITRPSAIRDHLPQNSPPGRDIINCVTQIILNAFCFHWTATSCVFLFLLKFIGR